MRTTVDIDSVVLREVKRLQKDEQRTLGAVVSELLAAALAARTKKQAPKKRFRLKTFNLGRPKLDLRDKAAIQALFDAEDFPR